MTSKETFSNKFIVSNHNQKLLYYGKPELLDDQILNYCRIEKTKRFHMFKAARQRKEYRNTGTIFLDISNGIGTDGLE